MTAIAGPHDDALTDPGVTSTGPNTTDGAGMTLMGVFQQRHAKCEGLMEELSGQCDKQSMYGSFERSTSFVCRVYCRTSIRLIHEVHQPYLQNEYKVRIHRSPTDSH